MIEVAAYGWSVGVDPALGAAILFARRDGRDVLRPTPAGCRDVLQTACFPLVPYANRIADGRFTFAGRAHQLPRNFGDHPHSLHGVGWQRAWDVAEHAPDALTLRYDHPGDAHWPWRFVADQKIVIDAAGLGIALTLTNTGDAPMPGGAGLHPYFPVGLDTRLTFKADAMWLADATLLSTERVPAKHFGDWRAGRSVVCDTLVDHAFEGWTGTATIADHHGTTTVAADARAMHLYIPPAAGFVCVEPVSHLPDAINRGGMPVLAPGETLRIAMTVARSG